MGQNVLFIIKASSKSSFAGKETGLIVNQIFSFVLQILVYAWQWIMKKEFLLNIFLLVFINFLVKPIYIFGVEARIQNLVDPTVYGVYFALFELVFLFQFINDPGIQSYSSKYISANRSSFNQFNQNLLGLKLILAGFFTISVLISFFVLGFNIELIFLLLLICGAAIINSLFMLGRTALSGLGFYRYDSIFSALDKIFAIFILGYISWFSGYQYNFDIKWLPAGQLVSGFMAMVVVVAVLLKKQYRFKVRINFIEVCTILKKSFPYATVILLMTLFYRIDGVMLERLLADGGYQAGLYAAAFRFMDMANMTGVLFGGLLLPMYSYRLARQESVRELFDTSFSLLMVIATVGFCIFVILSKDIYSLLYRDVYLSSHSLLKFLMVGAWPLLLSHSVGSMLLAKGDLKGLNLLFIATVGLNVLGNYLAIPVYGALGATVTSVITQWTVLLGMFYIASSKGLINLYHSQMFKVLIYSFAAFVLSFALSSYGNMPLLVKMSFICFVTIMLSFLMGVVNFRDILMVFKKGNAENKSEYLDQLALTERTINFIKPLKWLWYFYYFSIFKTVKTFGLRFKSTRRLFFGRLMHILLPDAGDIFIFGVKSHPSEIRLTRYLIKHLRCGSHFVDVGAHQGFYTLLAAELVGENGAVHAFEPTPSNFKVLQANTKDSKFVIVNNLALSSQIGTSDFYISKLGSSEYNSINPEGFEIANKITVQTTTLDEYAKRNNISIDMIKIDVEGHELDVLRGATSLLSAQSPMVIIEYIPRKWKSFEEAHRLMNRIGYKSHIIGNDGELQFIESPKLINETDSENLVYSRL